MNVRDETQNSDQNSIRDVPQTKDTSNALYTTKT